MASIHRLARALAGCRRSMAPPKALASSNRLSPSPRLQNSLCYRTFQRNKYSEASEHFPPRRIIDAAYADTDETSAKTPLPPQSPPTLSHSELVEIADKERARLEEYSSQSKGKECGFYPRFIVAVKDEKVTIKFKIPSTSKIPSIIADLVSRLGAKIDDDASSGSDMMLRAWNSGVAWQLTISRPGKQDRNGETVEQGKDIDTKNGDLCILMSCPPVGCNCPEIEFMKPGSLNPEELDALVSVMRIAAQEGRLGGDITQTPDHTPIKSLESMGVKIFGLNQDKSDDAKSDIYWENIAGYNQQKQEIEDTILLVLQNPEVFDEVDSFAVGRDRGISEVTRRILSILLQQIDGFDQEKKIVVVAATNRKQDLDPALVSRFDSMITFSLPDHQTRQEIAAQYAKHLTKSELVELANATERMSGRDIRDLCQQAERHWASKIIRGKSTGKEHQGLVPPLQEYIESAMYRQQSLLGVAGNVRLPFPSTKEASV